MEFGAKPLGGMRMALVRRRREHLTSGAETALSGLGAALGMMKLQPQATGTRAIREVVGCSRHDDNLGDAAAGPKRMLLAGMDLPKNGWKGPCDRPTIGLGTAGITELLEADGLPAQPANHI